MPKTAGCHAAGNRSDGTQAIANAMSVATPMPNRITRTDPASGEPGCAAGFWALRTIRDSGVNAQRKTAQNTSQ
jgi:hypothetical protein